MGPLWGHSALAFESENGKLLKFVRAAEGVPLQIVGRVITTQHKDFPLASGNVSDEIKNLTKHDWEKKVPCILSILVMRVLLAKAKRYC